MGVSGKMEVISRAEHTTVYCVCLGRCIRHTAPCSLEVDAAKVKEGVGIRLAQFRGFARHVGGGAFGPARVPPCCEKCVIERALVVAQLRRWLSAAL